MRMLTSLYNQTDKYHKLKGIDYIYNSKSQ